eukprot:scaffold271297_cov21-Tisochrysis_lutea.AAC.1
MSSSLGSSLPATLSPSGEGANPLLRTLLRTLKQLYLLCEAEKRSELAAEVLFALDVCKEDFICLAESLGAAAEQPGGQRKEELLGDAEGVTAEQPGGQLGAPEEPGGGGGCRTEGGEGGGSHGCDTHVAKLSVSVAASTSSPETTSELSPMHAALDSPNANALMLAQLEKLDIELLHEAAAYFHTPQASTLGQHVPHELSRSNPAEPSIPVSPVCSLRRSAPAASPSCCRARSTSGCTSLARLPRGARRRRAPSLLRYRPSCV